MIQYHRFSSGNGFVLHKIMLNGKKYSAWFRADGSYVDAERINNHHSVSVSKSHTKVIGKLVEIAKPYVRFAA